MENNVAMEELLASHASAKARMTRGIVFLIVAMGVEYLGLLLMGVSLVLGVLLILSTVPFWCMGIPFLITGIIGRVKANTRINALKAEQKKAQPQSAPEQPAEEQPAEELGGEEQPTEEQLAEEQVVEEQPAEEQPAKEQPQAAPDTAESGKFIDIDWEKYAPLDAGVSYNPTKDYQFHRADGFVGSVPQTFVNRTFPKCPICCTAQPQWTIAQHNQMSWKGNLYLFKCSCCEGIISMSMPDVTTLANGGSGVATHLSVGLTNLAVKASSGKEAGAIYAVIESVGKSGVTPVCEGKEFKLEHMQEMFLRM